MLYFSSTLPPFTPPHSSLHVTKTCFNIFIHDHDLMQPIGSLQAGALHTEKVLQQISEQVARLASAVSNISSALEERVTHADLSVASNKSDSNYSSVEERLARLERAVTVRASPGDHERAPVGLHVARLYAQLEATKVRAHPDPN